MEHHFDIQEASQYGIEAAIILSNLRFWIAKNKANGTHQYDGKTWTYNSVRAFKELFFYMGDKQIRNALSTLENCGVIVSGNYNTKGYDRTKWYALTEESSITTPFAQKANGLDQKANGFSEKGEPIPDGNTDGNTIETLSLSYKESKSFENDHPDAIEILHKLIPSSNFKGTWPKPGKPLFKKLKQSVIFLESLYSHKFFEEYAFGSKQEKNDSDLEIQENRRSWFKKHKIDPDKIKAMIGSWEELERVLKRAIRVWEDVKQPGYWPLNKTGLTHEFNDWIYNSRTGFSWFLYCLCNPAERLQDIAVESVMQKIPEGPRKNAEAYLKTHPEWDIYNFWNKALALWSWMQDNKQRLSNQNTAYEGTCGNFRLMFQCFSTFEAELTCGGKFQLNNFGIDCPTWNTFCSWMKKNYGISLQVKSAA